MVVRRGMARVMKHNYGLYIAGPKRESADEGVITQRLKSINCCNLKKLLKYMNELFTFQ